MVIAIDGPAASGKGTLARRLAERLGRPHLDTGLLYRAVALALLDDGTDLGEAEQAAAAAAALDPTRLTDPRLRSRSIGDAASIVSAHRGVREALLASQRSFAERPGGAVLDGRDIGTVVCPDADIKLYVTATAEERARRRRRELAAAGEDAAFETVLAEIRRRDARDQGRSDAPLRIAADAIVIDTTSLDAEGTFRQASEIVDEALRGKRDAARS